VEVPDAGTLDVTAVYTGNPLPEPSRIPIATDTAACGEVFTENLLVDRESRGLRNVVIRLEGITRGKAPPEKVVLDIRDCVFVPHVAAAMRGVRIHFRTSDEVRHTVHARIRGESLFNVPLSPGGAPPTPRPAPELGAVDIGCDLHSWMRGYLVVHSSPYIDVTGREGKLRIDGIPPGTYPYVAWHEQLGEKQGEVEVTARGTAVLKLEFKPPQ
jgi:plastocyanin